MISWQTPTPSSPENVWLGMTHLVYSICRRRIPSTPTVTVQYYRGAFISYHLISSDLVSSELRAIWNDPVRRGCDRSDKIVRDLFRSDWWWPSRTGSGRFTTHSVGMKWGQIRWSQMRRHETRRVIHYYVWAVINTELTKYCFVFFQSAGVDVVFVDHHRPSDSLYWDFALLLDPTGITEFTKSLLFKFNKFITTGWVMKIKACCADVEFLPTFSTF